MSRLYLLKSGKRRLLNEVGGSSIEIHELDKIQFEIQCQDSAPELYIEDYKVSLRKVGDVFISEEYQFFRESFGESLIRLYAEGKYNEYLANVLAQKVTCDKAIEIIEFLYERNPNLLKVDFSRTTIEKTLVSSNEVNFESFIDFSQNFINLLNKNRHALKTLIKSKVSKKINDVGGIINPEDVISNLDRLYQDQTSSDVIINNNFYSTKDIKGESLHNFYDFHENRVILSGLIYTKNQLYKIKEFLSGAGMENSLSFDKEYASFKEEKYNFSKIILQVTSDGLLKRINLIINDLDAYINFFKIKLNVNYVKPIYPLITNFVRNSKFYKDIFFEIKCLYECGVFGFNDVVSKIKIRSMSKIYEFFCFYKLEDVFINLGFNMVEQDILHNLPTKTIFDNELIEIEIQYEPKIPYIDDASRSGLVRLTYGRKFNFYNPDYVVSIKNKLINKESYYIFDAKFRSYQSLVRYEELEKLKSKYFNDVNYLDIYKKTISNKEIFGVFLIYPGDNKIALSQGGIFGNYISLPIFNGIPLKNNFDSNYIESLIKYTT